MARLEGGKKERRRGDFKEEDAGSLRQNSIMARIHHVVEKNRELFRIMEKE